MKTCVTSSVRHHHDVRDGGWGSKGGKVLVADQSTRSSWQLRRVVNCHWPRRWPVVPRIARPGRTANTNRTARQVDKQDARMQLTTIGSLVDRKQTCRQRVTETSRIEVVSPLKPQSENGNDTQTHCYCNRSNFSLACLSWRQSVPTKRLNRRNKTHQEQVVCRFRCAQDDGKARCTLRQDAARHLVSW